MPSLALLMFTRNDGDRALTSVRELSGVFDEVVLIDSSDPAEFARLREALPSGPARIHRVVPVGYVDLLRPYGISKVRADRALVLDSDESVSGALRDALSRLVEHDAYVVPRWEAALGVYTYHLRLFRPSSVRYGSQSWAFPTVTGSTGTLPKDHCLLHAAEYHRYLEREDRARRYLLIESYERPYTREYAREVLWAGERPVDGVDAGEPLSRPGVRTVQGLEFVRDLLRGGSLKSARFHHRYAAAKSAYLDRLPRAEFQHRLKIHREIRAAGGLVRYLGFDDPTYVDRLTESFDWSLDGPSVLERLIDGRHLSGAPIGSLSADPPRRTAGASDP